jgi:hypothetical protein
VKIVVAAALLLTGCLEPTHCETTYESAQRHSGGPIASGEDLIGLFWYPDVIPTSPFAALVSQTGVVSKSFPIPSTFNRSGTVSATGHASALWLAAVTDGLDGLAAAVLGDQGLTSLTISPVLAGVGVLDAAVVFDGHSYQLFWLAEDRLEQREVSEQGVMGDVHDLGPAANSEVGSVFAVTDDAGAVYVVVDVRPMRILAFDPTSATTRELWSGDPEEYTTAYWLSGEIHLRHDVWTDEIDSFEPATGDWRTQPMQPDLDNLELIAGTTTVYVWDYSQTLYELDSNLAVIAVHDIGKGSVGTFGSDWVVNASFGPGAATLTPGRVELTRGAAGSGDVVWKTDVVVDSPVVVGRSCGYDFPAENSNPGE